MRWIILAGRSEPVAEVEAGGRRLALTAIQRTHGGTLHHSGSFTPVLLGSRLSPEPLSAWTPRETREHATLAPRP